MEIKNIPHEEYPSGRGVRLRNQKDFREITSRMFKLEAHQQPLEISGLRSAPGYATALIRELKARGLAEKYDVRTATDPVTRHRNLYIRRVR